MERIRWAAGETADRTTSVTFFLWTLILNAGTATGAYLLSPGSTTLRSLIAIGTAIGGTILALAITFLHAYWTAPRQVLFLSLASLEEQVEGLQSQLSMLLEDKFGEPLRFLPVYETLRSDIRQSIRVIKRARDTDKLWSRTQPPDHREWKGYKELIATNPWAKVDNLHGLLDDAFGHAERLATSTALRLFDRSVKDSDDLDAALTALKEADERLTFSIDRLTRLSKGRFTALNGGIVGARLAPHSIHDAPLSD
jgi:hypothetical protein